MVSESISFGDAITLEESGNFYTWRHLILKNVPVFIDVKLEVRNDTSLYNGTVGPAYS